MAGLGRYVMGGLTFLLLCRKAAASEGDMPEREGMPSASDRGSPPDMPPSLAPPSLPIWAPENRFAMPPWAPCRQLATIHVRVHNSRQPAWHVLP